MIPKSFQVFSTFTPYERAELKAFARFNNEKQATSLIKLMDSYLNADESKNSLSMDAVLARKFPRLTNSQVRLLQSDLQKLMEKFILWKSLDTTRPNTQRTLLAFYKKKGLQNVLLKNLNNYKKDLSKRKLSALNYLEEKLIIAEESYELAIQSRKEAIDETNSLIEKLDQHFILKKLKYSCMVRAQENVYNIEFDHGLETEVLKYIERKELMQHPSIGTYYYCFKMLSSSTIGQDFTSFFQNLTKYAAQFSLDENKLLYTLAINYCIRWLNQGKKEFGRRGLDLYQSSLENGVLLTNGKLSKFTFRNMITIAVRLQEFDLAESFINDYQDHLEKKDRNNMVHFTTALILFSRHEYEKASLELLKVHFKDLLFNLASKGLLLKIYYEQNEFLVLRSHLDAMQIFLKRHKSLGYHKQNYLNIIKFTRKLINAKNKFQLVKIENSIKTENNLTEKRWLLAKIQEKQVLVI